MHSVYEPEQSHISLWGSLRSSQGLYRDLARCARLLVFFCTLLCALTPLCAEEDWSAFLAALEAHGYSDMTLVYLKNLQEQGATPPEWNGEIEYKIGAAAFDAWVQARGDARANLESQAREAFENYLEHSPEGENVPEANLGLARLLIDAADRAMQQVKQVEPESEAYKSATNAALRAYSDAQKYLDPALTTAQARAQKLQQDSGADAQKTRQAQAFFLDVLFRRANLSLQLAHAHDADSQERKDALESARSQFETIQRTYSQYAASFKARYYQAEAAHELGNDKEALALLSELALLPFEEQYLTIKTKCLALFTEIIGPDSDDPEKLIELVQKFYPWNEAIPTEYRESAEGSAVSLAVARALIRLETLRRDDYDRYIAAGRKVFIDKDDPALKLLNIAKGKKTAANNPIINLAFKLLNQVASGRGAQARAAREELKNPYFEGMDASQYSFAERASDLDSAVAISESKVSAFSLARSAYQDAAQESKESAKQEFDQAVSDALAAIDVVCDYARRAMLPDRRGKLNEEAAQKARAELDKQTINRAVICFTIERYEDAYVLGKNLALTRGATAEGVQGARVALQALRSLIAKERERVAQSESLPDLEREMTSFTEYIATLEGIEDDSLAQEVAVTKVDAAVTAGDFDLAHKLLDEIPENSSRRAGIELRLGQALMKSWNDAHASVSAQGVEEEDDQDEQARAEELRQRLVYACQCLEKGLKRRIESSQGVREDDVALIYDVYLLADGLFNQGNLKDSEQWLNHPVIGPLGALDRTVEGELGAGEDDSPLLPPDLAIATLALYLRIIASDVDRVEEAQKVMARLEETVGDSPEGQNKLTSVYLRLGKGLEERLLELKAGADAGEEDKQEQIAKTAQGFDNILSGVMEHGSTANYATLRWVADSYLALGRGVSGKSTPTKEALAFFKKASDAYDMILEHIDSDESYIPDPRVKLVAQLKRCEALRARRDFKTAFEEIKKIVVASPDNLDVQLESARLFQDWGAENPEYYVKAITGGGQGAKGEKLIWGWNGLIKRLAPQIDKNPRVKEIFYDAYVQKCQCRLQYVRSLKDQTARANQAREAYLDLERLYQIRADLGGAQSYRTLEKYYIGFQKAAGVKEPKGFKDAAKTK
ncbi:MAG: hypothetical protein Q4G03_12060 [Planctomycetia bacterium]|nr:hypothetical protein [Planctomycetia bacterium]